MIHLTRMKLTYSDKREKKFASFVNIAKEASFHVKTKCKCLCECSQMFLHLENYHHKEAVALFLFTALLVSCCTPRFHLNFWSVSFDQS